VRSRTQIIPICVIGAGSDEIGEAVQIGGYRTSSATQCKLRRVTGKWWLLAAYRRLGPQG